MYSFIQKNETFSELMDIALAEATMRNVGSLRGSFAKKQIKGRDYWYYQFTDLDGKNKQIYIGAESERVRELIAVSKNNSVATLQHIKQTAASAIKAGYSSTAVKQFNIINKLSDYGFFAVGGVLVGTHAFIAIGNTLGVKWENANFTLDVDFAHAGKSISIAMPANIKINLHNAIESLEMGFIPLSSFDGKHGGSYINPSSKNERIDFLTPSTGLSAAPVFIKDMGISLEPLKFMELSLEDMRRSVVISSTGFGAVGVNIPNPALFAVHKLIVAVERGVSNPKSNKDITQAASIIDFYADNDIDTITIAWRETEARGAGWKKRMQQGLTRMKIMYPEVYKKVGKPFLANGKPAKTSS
ncbi:MAG: GSU2403 family nucleotidyltransferase fold protein [Burkholderiales bacterium]